MVALNLAGAFSAASSAMVRGVDVTSTVHLLVADAAQLLSADSAGVLVRVADSDLELLAASSHRAAKLEIQQSQTSAGPCFDAVMTGQTLAVADDDEFARRWPEFARVLADAGLHSVHAMPLRWHGHVLGGLNLFWRGHELLSDEDGRTAQALADTCALAITQSLATEDQERLTEHVRTALRSRVVIERAKGVLGELEGVDMGDAFDRLVQLSDQEKLPLTTAAARIVDRARSR